LQGVYPAVVASWRLPKVTRLPGLILITSLQVGRWKTFDSLFPTNPVAAGAGVVTFTAGAWAAQVNTESAKTMDKAIRMNRSGSVPRIALESHRIQTNPVLEIPVETNKFPWFRTPMDRISAIFQGRGG